MSITSLEKGKIYSSNYHYFSNHFMDSLFKMIFNFKIIEFLKLVYNEKKRFKFPNNEPISLQRLFNLSDIMKFQNSLNALTVYDLHPLYKKFHENLIKGIYNNFGSHKKGTSKKINQMIKDGYHDNELHEKRKLGSVKSKVNMTPGRKKIFKKSKMVKEYRYEFRMSISETRVLLLTCIDFMKDRPLLVKHYED